MALACGRDAIQAANAHNRQVDLRGDIGAGGNNPTGVHCADVGFRVRPDGHTADIEI